mgnify:CR=1 FL=1
MVAQAVGVPQVYRRGPCAPELARREVVDGLAQGRLGVPVLAYAAGPWPARISSRTI